MAARRAHPLYPLHSATTPSGCDRSIRQLLKTAVGRWPTESRHREFVLFWPSPRSRYAHKAHKPHQQRTQNRRKKKKKRDKKNTTGRNKGVRNREPKCTKQAEEKKMKMRLYRSDHGRRWLLLRSQRRSTPLEAFPPKLLPLSAALRLTPGRHRSLGSPSAAFPFARVSTPAPRPVKERVE